MPTTALETERLILKPLTRADAVALVPLANDIEVSRWTASLPHPYGIDDADRWIEGLGPDDVGWTLHVKAAGGPIGAMGLRCRLGHGPGVATLGYWLGRPHWGCGYASEAAFAVVDHAVNVLRVGTVRAGVNPDNAGSLRVFEKLGLRFIESLNEHIPARDRIERTDYYERQADTWPI